MSSYSTNDYKLEFSGDYKTLKVIEKSTEDVVEEFELDGSTDVKVLIQNNAYDISETNCGTCYEEEFNLDEEVEMEFKNDGIIGVSDLRIATSPIYYDYDLETCAAYLRYVSSDEFLIKSPCSGNCQAPDEGCRTVS